MRNFIKITNLILFLILLFVSATPVAAQSQLEVLASAEGLSITANDLSPQGKRAYDRLARTRGEARSRLLSIWLAEQLIDTEAKARSLSAESLLRQQHASVPDPSADSINAVYEANRTRLGNRTLEEARPQIISLLRHDSEEKATQKYIESLQKKYTLRLGKDINSADLKPTDAIASIGTRSIAAREFEEANKIALYDAEAQAHEAVRFEIEDAILARLIEKEAAVLKSDASGVIAAEITNKMRDYSDEERADLEFAFQSKLFRKYNAKILFKEPAPLVLPVVADDDPAFGPADAPVTVVMFSDFQCPACARTHPVLKRVIGEYGEKIRFVVRDFPLESVHDRAMAAAHAANAANVQGKFLEYIDIMYRNQSALDEGSLQRYAQSIGLDVPRFDRDRTDAKSVVEIEKDLEAGKKYGVAGTPTIFVNGIKVQSLSAASFRRAIERAISGSVAR